MPPELVVRVIGDTSQLEKSFKRAQAATGQLDRNLGRAGRGATSSARAFTGLGRVAGFVGGAAALGALTTGVKAAFGELADSEKISAQTAAALKSTGGAANVTAAQIDRLSTRILNMSGIDDEATKAADNLLLTFTNVRNEVGKGNRIFDQASQAIADVATRLNGGAVPAAEQMSSAAVQIGKALNDPIKGLSSLTRIGVSFTKAQREQIKALTEAGDTMGAQKVILGELRKEFGGSAKAAGSTFSGQLAILTESLRNMGAEILKGVMPSIERLLKRTNEWITNAKNQKRIVDDARAAFQATAETLKTLKTVFDGLSKAVGGNKQAIEVLIGAYVTFKALKLASTVAGIARSFGVLTTAQTGATASTTGLTKSLVGKAGLAAAAGVASYELTTLAFKATGLDKKLKGLGGSAFDAAAKIGLVHDPTAQFKGKTVLSQGATRFLRNQAFRLEQGGLTPAVAAARLAVTHPNVAVRDIEVLAGVRGNPPRALASAGMTINGGIHLHGIQNVAQLEHELEIRQRRKAVQTRGREHRK